MAFLDAHKCKMIAPSTIMPSHKPITTHGSVRAPENHCKLLSLKSFVRRADAVFVYSVTIDTKTINDIRPYLNANKLPIRVSRYIWLRRCPFHLFVHIYFASHLIFGVAAHAVCAVFISGHNCISQKNIIFSSNICPRLCVLWTCQQDANLSSAILWLMAVLHYRECIFLIDSTAMAYRSRVGRRHRPIATHGRINGRSLPIWLPPHCMDHDSVRSA